MTIDKFNQVVNEQLEICRDLLTKKGIEYSFSDDRLNSFKVGAALQNNNQKQCMLGMLTKHIISIYDMILVNKQFDINKWTEKITDTMNYLLILKAMVVEEKDEQNRS